MYTNGTRFINNEHTYIWKMNEVTIRKEQGSRKWIALLKGKNT